MKKKQSNKNFSVDASPLNEVKLDLGLILCAAVLLYLLVERISSDNWTQLAILAVFGISASVWIYLRTYRVLQQITARASPLDRRENP